MKITSVKFSEESVRVLIDNEKLILPVESRFISLKADSEIDEDFFAELKTESDNYSAYLAALRYLRNIHSAEEVRRNLIKKGFSKKTAQSVMKKLEERKYINDYDFAFRLAENLKKRSYGSVFAESKLRQRGIDSAAAKNAVKEIFGTETCEEAMLNLLKKKYKSFDRAKCGRFLFSRGFQPDAVYRTLKNFENYLKEEYNESQRS
ncbi:MAG TPA: regulatory protein RecX [Spirochaetota bacterium]|nr:regulatory protein RecX [Spirochaetota bacterium]HQO23725.1 regulatory protein RecX [Spirochaetota bacterium]HQQ24252.1 regulatory protein RecX [Spirochaetota bacterium]